MQKNNQSIFPPKHHASNTHTHGGLEHDLSAMLARRTALGLIGGGGAALLASCADGTTSTPTTTTTTGTSGGSGGSSTSSECVSYSSETNGPYPGDGSNNANGAVANVLIESGIVRADMRPSFNGQTGTAVGVELEVTVTVMNTNNSCALLEGYAVYLWHCDAEGRYSVYDLPNQNYLRAVGVTDSEGKVTFTTVFPGCYAGRWPHFHFEVYESLSTATHYNNRIICSQMALPQNECAHVYSVRNDYGNSANALSGVSLASDNVFRDNSAAEVEAQTLELTGDTTNGYTGTVSVGLAL